MEKSSNPHLYSWEEDLLQKIDDKEIEKNHFSNEKEKLCDIKNKKEDKISSLNNIIDNTLNTVEKSIQNYSDNIVGKLEEIKNTKFESTVDRSKALFGIYKDLFKDAKVFFSKKEFNYENSSLKKEIKDKIDENINDKLLSILSYLFEDDNCENWTEILIPIWSMENQYLYMEGKKKKLVDDFNNTVERYEEKKKRYEEAEKDLEKMKKELEALKNFSLKINNFSDK